MATIKLKVSDEALGKVLQLLGQFNNEELEILESDQAFIENKKYLESELARLESGNAKSYSIEEVDRFLEETIRSYGG